jgi:hypothetical protein
MQPAPNQLLLERQELVSPQLTSERYAVQNQQTHKNGRQR